MPSRTMVRELSKIGRSKRTNFGPMLKIFRRFHQTLAQSGWVLAVSQAPQINTLSAPQQSTQICFLDGKKLCVLIVTYKTAILTLFNNSTASKKTGAGGNLATSFFAALARHSNNFPKNLFLEHGTRPLPPPNSELKVCYPYTHWRYTIQT